MESLIPLLCKNPPSALDIFNNKDEGEKIYNDLKSKKSIKILDLGCNVPILLMLGYHEFNTSVLIGVDEKDEETCILKYADSLIEEENNSTIQGNVSYGDLLKDYCFTFFDCYKIFICPDNNSYKKKLLDKN